VIAGGETGWVLEADLKMHGGLASIELIHNKS
jgi:hypothetical protein